MSLAICNFFLRKDEPASSLKVNKYHDSAESD